MDLKNMSELEKEQYIQQLQDNCVRDFNFLNKKLKEADEHKSDHYHVWLIDNDLVIEFDKMKKKVKSEGEKELYDKLYKEYMEYKNKYEQLRGDVM